MNDMQRIESRARRIWVSIIVGLLSLQVGIGVTAIVLATGDQSVAVVPGYHQAALDWDRTHRQRTAADRLGIDVSIETSDIVDLAGQRRFVVHLTDASGAAWQPEALHLTAFHHARASRMLRADLEPLEAGGFQGLVPIARSGLWDVELSFVHEQEVIRVVRTLEM